MLSIVHINSTIVITNIFNNLTLINFITLESLIKRSSKYFDN